MVMGENNLYCVTSSEMKVFETAFWCMLVEVRLKPSVYLPCFYGMQLRPTLKVYNDIHLIWR